MDSSSGFQPKDLGLALDNLYKDFEGNPVWMTKPRSFTASKLYIYPDKSRVWGGADYHAMVHLAKAFNFKSR